MIQYRKSIKLNMLLNSIKEILIVIFPIFTFPYVSRILGVENLGSFNFSNTLIGYFILFAGLGIATYAIREGSPIRENKIKIKKFADEMFTINIIFMLLSYLLLLITVWIFPQFVGNKKLLMILSLEIFLSTIGVDWIFSIYEDYMYISIRTLMIQILSIILIFLCVKQQSDIYKYAIIIILTAMTSSILNFYYARKYCKIGLTKRINWRRHMKSIFTLFAMSATVTVYVASDITILGIFYGDHYVGIYSVSVKIYNIIKMMLSSILIVAIPRLSAFVGKSDRLNFEVLASNIYKTLISFMIPAFVGVLILRKEIVLAIAGKEYLDATSSLSLLTMALVFCLGAWFWGQCILVPYKKETLVFKITFISAIVNILTNLICIPFGAENAAAFTTILSEGMAFLCCYIAGNKIVKIDIMKTCLKSLIGALGIIVGAGIIKYLKLNLWLHMVFVIVCSIFVYFIIELIIRNEVIINFILPIVKFFQKCFNRFNR